MHGSPACLQSSFPNQTCPGAKKHCGTKGGSFQCDNITLFTSSDGILGLGLISTIPR